MLYPLKFNTIYKDKIWGGNKINNVLGKDYGSLPNCGETWELSGVEGNISIISNGRMAGLDLRSLLDRCGPELMGNRLFKTFGSEFPLLVKFIDANDDLSIQVHPNDTLASKRHNSFGKTEMWYVVQADEGASLISGFTREITRKDYEDHFGKGTLTSILNRVDVRAGDVFFLPAGRVHTIGKGLLIAEIQQTSDITYRIYDFDRTDDQGDKRELHVQEALDAIDYSFHPDVKTRYEPSPNTRVSLVSCPYFTTNLLDLNAGFGEDLPDLDSFRIYLCLEGEAIFKLSDTKTTIGVGELLLMPASITSYEIEPSPRVKLLESYIE